ncbi:MAG: hypothetical protein WKF66_04345 [Pedobacter sp.]
MPDQLTTNGDALRLFFTDDVYIVNEPAITWGLPPEPVGEILATADVVVAPVAVEVEAKRTSDFTFLGGNKRNILILVNDEQNDVSDESGKDLLRKIVKSINLVTADFALVNYARHQGASFDELRDFFKSSLVFSFGVKPSQLGLKDHPANTVVLEGEVRMVFSDELRKMDADLAVKKALWGVLQKLAI